MTFRALIYLFIVFFSSQALSSKLIDADDSQSRNFINKPYEVKLKFSEDDFSCGLKIDWGDGQIQKIRVGKTQELKPPYLISHVFSKPGTYRILISGEPVFRGLSSVLGCDGELNGEIDVAEPATPSAMTERNVAKAPIESINDTAENKEKTPSAGTNEAKGPSSRSSDPRQEFAKQQSLELESKLSNQERLKKISAAYECVVPSGVSQNTEKLIFSADNQIYVGFEVKDGGLPPKAFQLDGKRKFLISDADSIQWEDRRVGFSNDETHSYLIDKKTSEIFVTFSQPGQGKVTKKGPCKNITSLYTGGVVGNASSNQNPVPADLKNAVTLLFGSDAFIDTKSCVISREKDAFNSSKLFARNLDFSSLKLSEETDQNTLQLLKINQQITVFVLRGKSVSNSGVVQKIENGKQVVFQDFVAVPGARPGQNPFGVGIVTGAISQSGFSGNAKSTDDVKALIQTLSKYCRSK